MKAAIVALALLAAAPAPAATEPTVLRYSIQHDLVVKDLPANAKSVRVWFWFPPDTREQKVLDVGVREAPLGTRITRESHYGNRYLYAESNGPAPLKLSTEFSLERHVVSIPLDPAKAGPLTPWHRALFADDLNRVVPNMEVTPAMQQLADQLCGSETNVVKQARALYDYIVKGTSHYSKPGGPKSSQRGSAEYCLANKGGACTDMHALFIALARARGIPTRLHFGSRLQAKNEGKDHDPGYRCWVEYFVPGYGWVPTDLAAANTDDTRVDFYFSGLDCRRLEFAEGRNLDLEPHQSGGPLNLLIIAYVEVDGKPWSTFERHVKFTIQP